MCCYWLSAPSRSLCGPAPFLPWLATFLKTRIITLLSSDLVQLESAVIPSARGSQQTPAGSGQRWRGTEGLEAVVQATGRGCRGCPSCCCGTGMSPWCPAPCPILRWCRVSTGQLHSISAGQQGRSQVLAWWQGPNGTGGSPVLSPVAAGGEAAMPMRAFPHLDCVDNCWMRRKGGRAEPEVPTAWGVPEDEGVFGGVPARLCSPLLGPAGQPGAIQPPLPLLKVLCQGAGAAKGGQFVKEC